MKFNRMNRTLNKAWLSLVAVVVVGYPLWIHVTNVDWTHGYLLVALFPMFGLAAFTLLWLHIVSGVFESWLREQFDFDSFVHWTSLAILILILLHPLILLSAVDFRLSVVFGFGSLGIWLGIIGFILLITYDVGKFLRKKDDFFVHHWRRILVISTIGFILIFFHSLLIGTDTQTGFLRWVWWFYGLTGIGAALWLYWPRSKDRTLTIHE